MKSTRAKHLHIGLIYPSKIEWFTIFTNVAVQNKGS